MPCRFNSSRIASRNFRGSRWRSASSEMSTGPRPDSSASTSTAFSPYFDFFESIATQSKSAELHSISSAPARSRTGIHPGCWQGVSRATGGGENRGTYWDLREERSHLPVVGCIHVQQHVHAQQGQQAQKENVTISPLIL